MLRTLRTNREIQQPRGLQADGNCGQTADKVRTKCGQHERSRKKVLIYSSLSSPFAPSPSLPARGFEFTAGKDAHERCARADRFASGTLLLFAPRSCPFFSRKCPPLGQALRLQAKSRRAHCPMGCAARGLAASGEPMASRPPCAPKAQGHRLNNRQCPAAARARQARRRCKVLEPPSPA
jgi:hypothetical protein